jgi:predicted HicB family RNase H-like nuclease
VKASAFALNMWSIEMNDKATTPTSLRLPDGLIRQLTKAAHKMEMSRTQYITDVLQAAVNKTLEQKK